MVAINFSSIKNSTRVMELRSSLTVAVKVALVPFTAAFTVITGGKLAFFSMVKVLVTVFPRRPTHVYEGLMELAREASGVTTASISAARNDVAFLKNGGSTPPFAAGLRASLRRAIKLLGRSASNPCASLTYHQELALGCQPKSSCFCTFSNLFPKKCT